MDSDEEDYVFFGTPIEREEEIASRKKKAVAEAAGQMRTLPPWKQEVTDEEGRRRFHGAFTGGYSAGYYNTVGSKEGWTPQSFTSSRKNRAEIKQQNILNFLDDDEKAEMEGRSLGTSMLFDTFGFTAAELARKQAEKEQQQRPSIIPGPAPDEIVLPATDSIGAKLLLKMGWRHGHAIRDSRTNSMYDARREARKAFLAFSSDDAVAQLTGSEPVKGELESAVELPINDDHQFPQSTLVFVCNPKQDLHGLGYDPFKHAPEFREKKRSRLHGDEQLGHRKPLSMKESLFALRSGRAAPGFGIGALEELDDEDEDVYAPGYGFEETYVQEDEEHSRPSVDIKEKWNKKEQGILPGFKMASIFDYKLERFDPPVIPKDFAPCHTFPAPLDVHRKFSDAPPPEAYPPEDNNLKVLIEGVATIVARCGKLFEDLSREKNQSNPLFSFLNGGYGHDYYLRKLWEEQQKRSDQNKPQLDGQMFARVQKMTAESRGKILGEKPLERSSEDTSSTSVPADIHLQFNLSDTFTKPASFGESTGLGKPFRDDPEKQERFEQFLKQKYHGGLRSKDSGGASSMSEAARAREKLEFEAAAEAVEKGKWGKETSKQIIEMSVATGLQFTSGGLEKESKTEEIMKNMYPKREEFQWRPSPILCKRFDIMDPYLGKPLPPPRVRSKMDSLVFMPDSVKPARAEETAAAHRDSLPLTQLGIEQVNKEEAEKELAVDVEAENVERPVDLYKAIFSDDSEGEEESLNLKQEEDPKRKIEAGNTTLNRLIAGDFLESLGKELGLEVPPELPYAENKTGTTASWKETVNTTTGNVDTPLPKTKLPSTENAISRTSIGQEVPENNVHREDNLVEDGSRSPELANVGWGRISGNMETNVGWGRISGSMETVSGENKSSKVKLGKAAKVDRASRTPSDRHRNSRSSSSGDERSRKRSRRRHRHRSISSDDDTADSSEHYQDRHRSRSSKNKKRSSREKNSSSSSRKKSKHRKREDSVGRPSHRGTDAERREAKREKRG